MFVVIISLGLACKGPSHEIESEEEKQVIEVLDVFFESLETQDTTAFKNVLLMEGQVWSTRQVDGVSQYAMRYFSDDVDNFDPEVIVQERPLDYEIKLHKNIAMAWVPYTLDINGVRSHCGVDIFTLFKTDKGWRISNVSYTVEPDGCGDFH